MPFQTSPFAHHNLNPKASDPTLRCSGYSEYFLHSSFNPCSSLPDARVPSIRRGVLIGAASPQVPAVNLPCEKRGSMAGYSSSLLLALADRSSNNNNNNNNMAVPMISATRHIGGDDPAQPDQGGVDKSAGASAADSSKLYINNASVNAKLMAAVREGATQVPEMFIEPDKLQCVSNMDLEGGGSESSMKNSGSMWEAGDLDIPVLDLALLQTSSSSNPNLQRTELVAAAAKACQQWGFFQVQNHGIDSTLIANCEAESNRMFGLPLDLKERCHREPGESFGYGANTWVNQKVMHWAESFHMQMIPKNNIQEMAAKMFDHTTAHTFSSAIEEYMAGVEDLAVRVVKLLTEGLGLHPDRLVNDYLTPDRMTSMRFNFYPKCPEPRKVIGLRAHTDPHLITVLHQDSVPGLQVRVAGTEKWITVKPRKDCFVINIGDLLMVYSNRHYKSVEHRAFVNGQHDRLSLAFFLNPPLHLTVEAPPELITPQYPKQYRPFTFKEYLSNAYKNHPKTGSDRHEYFFLNKGLDVPVSPAPSVH